ncbi:CBS domain protein [Micromonospora olivasterospora]|uniref:CBS domain protein n=1 Tax=Micromonospora olivasterospora TaxID=1880 RepID=A0A562I918_MICOL|nr:CBS domain protein [Micromonospora olivasterospora]
MPTARDIMTSDVACVREQDDLRTAARQMARLGVGSLPICGDDNRLKGGRWDTGARTSRQEARARPCSGRQGWRRTWTSAGGLRRSMSPTTGGARATVSPRAMARTRSPNPRRRISARKWPSGDRNTG